MTQQLTAEQEHALVQHCQRDPAAIRDLYHHYHPKVFAYVAHRVGRQTDAEDITSEIFVRIVQSLQRFEYRGEGSLSAWIFSIARNEVRRLWRKQSRWQIHDTPVDELPTIASDATSPLQDVMAQETYAMLRQHINQLSDRRQEIIRLRFYAGLRNREIAEVLNLNERTIASHLCRALDDLRNLTEQHQLMEERHER